VSLFFSFLDINCNFSRQFIAPRKLIISTLMGSLTYYDLDNDPEEGSVVVQDVFHSDSASISKVNALVADDKRIIVGGFSLDGKGVIEIWKQG